MVIVFLSRGYAREKEKGKKSLAGQKHLGRRVLGMGVGLDDLYYFAPRA